MNEITLEKIDIVRERTGVTYSEAKEALEASNANVVDALIYLEKNKKCNNPIYTTKEEFLSWLRDLIAKGNITRIRIRKEDKVIVDLPVNAGIAIGVLVSLIWAPLLAIGVLGAVFTKITIEITKQDGTVEVVNKVIKSTVQDVKEKVSDVASEVKDKVTDVAFEMKEKVTDAASDMKGKFGRKKNDDCDNDQNVYKYTVRFDELDNDNK